MTRWHYGIVLLLLVLHAGLLGSSMVWKSATVDELSHLAAGLHDLETRDFRMNRQAPPLQNIVCALPVYLFAEYQLSYDTQCWNFGIWNGLGTSFVQANPETFHQLLLLGRVGTIVLSILLCVLLFYCAKQWWGVVPAMVVLLLAVLEPNLLAHGRLTTTDTSAVLFFLLTGFALDQFLQKPEWKRLLFIGAAFALTWLSKHSGFVLLPTLFIIFVFMQFLPDFRNLPVPYIKRKSARAQKFVYPLFYTAVIAITGFSVIWCGYAFEVGDQLAPPLEPYRYSLWNSIRIPLETFANLLGFSRESWFDSQDMNNPLWSRIRSWLPALNHWEGFAANQLHLRMGHLSYFMGTLYYGGILWYYPVLLLTKTPIALLVIFGMGVILLLNRTIAFPARRMLLISGIPAFYLLVLVFYDTANIGYRHFLPVVPYLLLICAGGCAAAIWRIVLAWWLRDVVKREEKILVGLFFMCIVWVLLENLLIYPHYLEYFNQLSGGARNGHWIAADSNLDWGQDLFYVKEYIEENDLHNSYLFYFGPPELPDAYGVPHQTFRGKVLLPGNYVISASFLHGIGAGELYESLEIFRQREPDDYITSAVFFYSISEITSESD
jgi:hypothetical protein